MEWSSDLRTGKANQFLLCCFFVVAFASSARSASSASSAKSSNLSPGENVIEEPNALGQEPTPEQIANYFLTMPSLQCHQSHVELFVPGAT